MQVASANLPIANFDLRTQFVAPAYVEPEPEPTDEVFIEEDTVFDNQDPNSLEVPGTEPAPAEGELFENPAPEASPETTPVAPE